MSARKGPDGLTVKQENFAAEYVKNGGNAAEAYRQAYDAARMSEKAVWTNASQLLADAKVALRVASLRQAAMERAVVDEARVLEEVARLGLADPSRLFDAEGRLLPIHQIPPEVRASIASMDFEPEKDASGKVVGHKLVKVKLWDKNASLEKLMKHLGMFEKDNKQRAGVFEGLPKSEIDLIVEKLRASTSAAVRLDRQPVGTSTSRFTH